MVAVRSRVHGFVEHGMHERDSNIHESIGKGKRWVDDRKRKRIGGLGSETLQNFPTSFSTLHLLLADFWCGGSRTGGSSL